MDTKLYGIMGRKKNTGKFKPVDYKEGVFVTNVIHQTLWEDKQYVLKLIEYMNNENIDLEFKIITRN